MRRSRPGPDAERPASGAPLSRSILVLAALAGASPSCSSDPTEAGAPTSQAQSSDVAGGAADGGVGSPDGGRGAADAALGTPDGGERAVDAGGATDIGGRAADGGGGEQDTGGGGSAGVVVYRSETDGHLYRIAATEGAAPVDLSAALDGLSPGSDDWINISPDGRWLLIGTDRFGCDGWPCAVKLSATLDEPEVVRTADGEPIHPAFSAISSDGDLVVYPVDTEDGTGLAAVHRVGGGWSAPLDLTAASPYPEHQLPALAEDGSKLLLTCGQTPYAQASTGICEVGGDGTGFRVVVRPEDGPGGTPSSSLRAPDYGADGSIVFEASWDGEQVWSLSSAGVLAQVTPTQHNDNSPCGLPGGRVASLWLERPGSQGFHELKITQQDGSAWTMAVIDVDVSDVGIGCGR